jgi:hypothetical protein
MENLIRCTKCGDDYPLNGYYKSKHISHKCGYITPCKVCMKKATKEIVTFLAFATTISIVYLGVLLGLVYTAVKVAKHAWQ